MSSGFTSGSDGVFLISATKIALLFHSYKFFKKNMYFLSGKEESGELYSPEKEEKRVSGLSGRNGRSERPH